MPKTWPPCRPSPTWQTPPDRTYAPSSACYQPRRCNHHVALPSHSIKARSDTPPRSSCGRYARRCGDCSSRLTVTSNDLLIGAAFSCVVSVNMATSSSSLPQPVISARCPPQAQNVVQETFTKLQPVWPRLWRADTIAAHVQRMLANANIDESRPPWRRERPTAAPPETPVREKQAKRPIGSCRTRPVTTPGLLR